MRTSVIVFPGSNCDRDVAVALTRATGRTPAMVWHGDAAVPKSDLIVLPGGFSYGDYLRCGAMAAHSAIMADVVRQAKAGVAVLGICNGFQILCEAGLLPGVLMRNASMRFICRDVTLKVERTTTMFTQGYDAGAVISLPIAHAEGNYFASADELGRLEQQGQVILRYCDAGGAVTAAANPNGALNNIAGLADASGRVMGLMPHPERAADPLLGKPDGTAFFAGLAGQVLAA
jgi:phosphoribosylformylglycinamidine synthase subunit PurQ / glutaminase